MTKNEIISKLAEKTGRTKRLSGEFLEAFMSVVGDALEQGERIKLVGFGTFEVRERKSKCGSHPITKEPITIDGRKSPIFRPGKELKDKVNA